MTKTLGERVSALEERADGHDHLDDTRFEHIKTNLESIWRRSGRMELAMWTCVVAMLAWALPQVVQHYAGPPAAAHELRGPMR